MGAAGDMLTAALYELLDENGRIYCVEINTLPGMTPTSLVPQEAEVVGISYGELCEKIIEIALRKE